MEKPQNNETMPLANGFNFMPRDGRDDTRVRMRVSADELARLPIKHRDCNVVLGVVTDLDTGVRYQVVSASCGLAQCVCDAVIREIC